MKRTLKTLMALAAFAFAASANAATVVMLADSNTVFQGGTIVLHAVVSATSETDNNIFGAILYQDAFLSANAANNSQTAIAGWTTSSGVLSCTTVRCVSFSQINANGVQAIPGGAVSLSISSTEFVVDATTPIGTVLTFNWQSTPTTQRLDFFGVTSAPGTTVTVVPIPEPTTAAMLGLGLFGLALAGRRRS